MMRANLLLFLLIAIGATQAQTQSDLNRSACADLDAADAEAMPVAEAGDLNRGRNDPARARNPSQKPSPELRSTQVLDYSNRSTT
jgi:hypothetical protein